MHSARFVWARNRNANGRGSDPMPQIIFDDVGVSHLEIVASHEVGLGAETIDYFVTEYPAPIIGD